MRIPKYRFHKSSGQAMVEFKGRRYYLGLHGTRDSKAAYRKFLDDRVYSQTGELLLPAKNIGLGEASIAELCRQFIRHARKYYGEGTAPFRAFDMVARQMSADFGIQEIREFGPIALQSLRKTFATSKKSDRVEKRSRPYVNRLTYFAVKILEWGITEQLVSDEQVRALERVPPLLEGKHEFDLSEPDEVCSVGSYSVDIVLPFLRPMVAAMVQVQLLGWMRPGEVCKIKIEEIHIDGELWIWKPGTHKNSWRDDKNTGKYGRLILLGPKAQLLLKPWLPIAGFVFSAARAREQWENEVRKRPSKQWRRPAHERQPGECYTTESYSRAVRRGLDRTVESFTSDEQIEKFEPWSPRQLRKNAATQAREKHGLEAAQILLGHSKADVTQLYAERDLEKARAVARLHG